MKVFTSLENLPVWEKPLVLTLGYFDGLHLGHQKIFNAVTTAAHQESAFPALVTFQEHPQTILRPDLPGPQLLTPLEHRLLLMERSGIELCFTLPFTEPMSKLLAEDFVQLLLDRLKMKKMCLGFNAHFGQGRQGNAELMNILSAAWGFAFEEIGPVSVLDEPVSSSRIRKLLLSGNLLEAQACLGRPYSLIGNVVSGDGRGKKLGFPTANVDAGFLPPLPYGVYPVEVAEIELSAKLKEGGVIDVQSTASGNRLWGVLNYGVRPTFEGKPQPVLEIHFFNFEGSLYGKTLEIFAYPIIRKEVKFDSVEQLKAQIQHDVEFAKKYFIGRL